MLFEIPVWQGAKNREYKFCALWIIGCVKYHNPILAAMTGNIMDWLLGISHHQVCCD
jgi:hypothetical protein